MQKKTTIKDIARIAGVSHSTVSRSLNDSPMISEKTKELIRRIARDMHFEFNANARSLSTRRTGTVAVVYNEQYETMGSSLYLNRLLRGIHLQLERESIDTLVLYTGNSSVRSSNIRRVIQRQKVDGLLILNPSVTGEDWQTVRESRLPFAAVHFKPLHTSYRNMNYVFADHEFGGFTATELLIRNGCRKILCIREDSNELQFIERTAGYRKALEANSIPVNERLILSGECSFAFGYQTIADHQGLLPEIDGIFCEADILALGAMEALKELHISIPGQMPVVGYDDIEFSSLFKPELTTVHQPWENMVDLACSRLVSLIQGTDSDEEERLLQEIIKPELVVRTSCPAE